MSEPFYHIQVKAGEIGRYVLLPGDPFRTDHMASFLKDAKLIAHNREHKTWVGTLLNERVAITSTGMGCPSTAICVEELIKAGADTFIRVGTAGPVKDPQDEFNYDGAICTAAVRDEGTSLNYMPLAYPAIADRQVVDALIEAAKANKGNYLVGITHTKDSFYGEVEPQASPMARELLERWAIWQKGGVVCSEMESAILFILSSIKHCRASAIMSFHAMDKTIQIACDALKILIAKDQGK
ncbi:MAG: nucleoside phosphorylase [Erysipelotrichaceae bacterium]|jgi:uridine phosphorylase|nr:nucleoside phosphorylase [Erysipelotrichaceae bacterium]